MPLEELMAMYGYGPAAATAPPSKTAAAVTGESSSNSSMDQSASQVPNAQLESGNAPMVTPNPLWTRLSGDMDIDEGDSSSEGDEDYEEEGAEDWRRSIHVGPEYQAQVPDGLSHYDGVPAYENEDTLLWDPTLLHDKEVEEYLKQIQHLKNLEGDAVDHPAPDGSPLVSVIPDPNCPIGTHIRDDQQALYLLHQCGHKAEEALRRRRMQSLKNGLFDPMTSWSEEECRNFEEGLRIYGKDFYLIQENKVTCA